MNSDAIFVFVVELSELRRSVVDESKYEVCGALAPLNLSLSLFALRYALWCWSAETGARHRIALLHTPSTPPNASKLNSVLVKMRQTGFRSAS